MTDVKKEIVVGNLVEVIEKDPDPKFNLFGLRLFVIDKITKANGEALYSLSHRKDVLQEYNETRSQMDQLKFRNLSEQERSMIMVKNARAQGAILKGFTSEMLQRV